MQSVPQRPIKGDVRPGQVPVPVAFAFATIATKQLLRCARCRATRFSKFEFGRARAELSDRPGGAGGDFPGDHYVN
jgi:hypothetical protein